MRNIPDKMFVPICRDHFTRLMNGTVCGTCPSRLENEDMVLDLSEKYKDDIDSGYRALIAEVASIRRSMEGIIPTIVEMNARLKDQAGDITKLDHIINGNGQRGLREDVASLRARSNMRSGYVQLVVSVASALMALIFGIMAFSK